MSTINAQRFYDLFSQLRHIGSSDRGINRVAWTEQEWSAKDWAQNYLASAGFNSYIDGAGNVIGLWEPHPGAPFVLMGSHLDTVPDGGAYDGALGVIGAIEAVLSLRESHIAIGYNVGIVCFADEEGVTLGDGLLGSRALIAQHTTASLKSLHTPYDHDLSDVVKPFGRSIDSILGAKFAYPIAAYLELHVEQGPVLDKAGIPIGIVSTIAGRRQGRVSIRGQANHAGTTPMGDRHDALVQASRAIIALQEYASRHHVVGTVGSIRVEPDAPNVIPGHAHFTYDIRGINDDTVSKVEQQWLLAAKTSGCELNISHPYTHSAVPTDESLRHSIQMAAEWLDLPALHMPSMAVHDAMVMASVTPTAMIFVPSRRGISHARGEFTSQAHCLNGVEVLARTLYSVIQGPPQTQKSSLLS